MNHKKHLLFATACVIIGTPVTYWILSSVYKLPEAASSQANTIDSLFTGHFILISFLFAVVVGFSLYALVVFRRRAGDEGDGEFIHGSNTLEVAWTVGPMFLVIGFSIWGWQALDTITEPKSNEKVIQVTGQKWNWTFGYPEYGEFAQEPTLTLQVGQPVLLEMEARDVIHSFWVPQFRVKQDLLPGRKTNLRITPTELGEYQVICSEICGQRHAYMVATVRVLDATAYIAWEGEMKALASLSPIERGERLWQTNCSSCHSIDGTKIVGPSWLGLYGREEALSDGSVLIVDDTYIINSIYEPNSQIVAGYQANLMPAIYEDTLSDQDVANLIEFIKTLTETE